MKNLKIAVSFILVILISLLPTLAKLQTPVPGAEALGVDFLLTPLGMVFHVILLSGAILFFLHSATAPEGKKRISFVLEGTLNDFAFARWGSGYRGQLKLRMFSDVISEVDFLYSASDTSALHDLRKGAQVKFLGSWDENKFIIAQVLYVSQAS